MRDVLILALNSGYIHSALAPWYLCAAVSPCTCDVLVSEHTVNEDPEAVLKDIFTVCPRILACSVYIWNVTEMFAIAKRVKEHLPDTVIVFGGPEVSYNAAEVLSKHTSVDYVICGEGEIPFLRLCAHLLRGEPLCTEGIAYREGGEIRSAKPYIGTGTPKSPYTDAFFAALNGRISYFESSRGCPYTCAYCLSGRCEGMRFFDETYVYENLIRLANSGTKTVKFVDRTFNADRKRACAIFRFLIENQGRLFPGDVCFHFELSGDLLDDATMDLLKTAPRGLFQFEIGIQSFNPQTIRAIHRKTDSDLLTRRIGELVEIGHAHVHIDLIAGLPYEGYESFADSFDRAYALHADMLQLGFLKILHGTELEEKAAHYGLAASDEPPYEVCETPWISQDELASLKIVANAVERLSNSGRFKRTLRFCLSFFARPFSFFKEFGACIREERTPDGITERLYDFLCARIPERAEEIRDALVCDRLATNSSRGLPSVLYRSDPRLKEIAKKLSASTETAPHPGVRRSTAILYGCRKAVYADYDRVAENGEYELHFIPLEEET